MEILAERLRSALGLKPDEEREFVVLTGYVFAATAVAILLSAAKNGLFLSVYPDRLIPHAMIAAALLAAALSVALSGVLPRFSRKRGADGLAVFLLLSLLASRVAFAVEPASAFVLYVWLSVVQVLVATHTWGYTSSFFTGRQAKRLMPLVGIGASVAVACTGFGLAPAAELIGTPNLLIVASLLILATLFLRRLVPVPEWDVRDEDDEGVLRSFVHSAGEGLRSVSGKPLLRVLAVSAVLLVLAGTLVDFHFKLAVQERFARDRITGIYGLLYGGVGIGTVVMQLLASRVLFPRLGASRAAVGHAGTIGGVAALLAALGSFGVLVALQFLDEVLRHSIERPVEQVSLLPFPPRVKNGAHTTLHGVLRPLTKAVGGGIALLLVARPNLIPVVVAVASGGAALALRRHRGLYLHALETALAQHTLEFSPRDDVPLVVDDAAGDVIDRGLEDDDATVVVFALSLLQELPPERARPRAIRLLGHPVEEVRAEAATVLGRLEPGAGPDSRAAVLERLRAEDSPMARAALIRTLGRWSVEGATDELIPFLDDPDPEVRRAALVTLCRLGWERGPATVERLLGAGPPEERATGVRAAGDLRMEHLLPEVGEAVADPETRPAALEALDGFGTAALPTLQSLVGRERLPLPVRRTLITTLAGVDAPAARDLLMDLVDHDELGPAALTSLKRLRKDGRMSAVEGARLDPLLRTQAHHGWRYALIASSLDGDSRANERRRFVASELTELRNRAVHRVLAILSLGYDPERLAMVEANLFSDDATARSNALELLEGLIGPREEPLVLPLAEAAGADEDVPLDGGSVVPDPDFVRRRPVQALLDEQDWWPRALGVYAASADEAPDDESPKSTPDTRELSDEERAMIPLIEKVMLLKGSELFRTFPGEELAGIAELTEEAYLDAGEVVFEEGDRGDAFYMVVRGAVRITRGGQELAILGSREGFGEMAILDQESRSATATAEEDTTVLRIDRDDFDRLVEANPAVARGIYRVLTQRLRSTLAKVAAA